jgi:DNA-binding NarL/FixJ family response regulator
MEMSAVERAINALRKGAAQAAPREPALAADLIEQAVGLSQPETPMWQATSRDCIELLGRVLSSIPSDAASRDRIEALRNDLLARQRKERARYHAPRCASSGERLGALTKTERRVALLLADGHTNRAAAAELVVSPHTVAAHARSIFEKLGISSRVALARAVFQEQPGSRSL